MEVWRNRAFEGVIIAVLSIPQVMGFSHTSLLAVVLLATLLAVSDTEAQATKVITVDKNGTALCCVGNDDTTPCANLSQALACAERPVWLRVMVHINQGNYTLNQGPHQFLGKRAVEIIGEGRSEVVITCEPQAGIAFNHSANIRISDLTLVNCGVQQLSTNGFESEERLHFNVAVYFVFCRNLIIHNVEVSGSVGMAMALYNVNEDVDISNSDFDNGKEINSTAHGGGGIYIEFFTNCVNQWIFTCKGTTKDIFSQNARYSISHCSFSGNIASAGAVQTTHIQRDGHFSFGRGGGLAAYVRENAANIALTIEHSLFYNNTAEIGGGFVIFLFDESSNVTVTVAHSNITDNRCAMQYIPPSIYSSGGGADFALRTGYYGNNNVTVSRCSFTGNTAYWGGGLTIESQTVNNSINDLMFGKRNRFVVEDCHFEGNSARIGSAVELTCGDDRYNLHRICSATPHFRNCQFLRNNETYTYDETNNATGHHKGRTFATFHSVNQPVEFSGEVTFEANNATGLGLQDCNAALFEHSSLLFLGNRGKIGGGLALMGKSNLILVDGTTLNFTNNNATERGGAIFASQGQEHFAAYSHTCFVTYIKAQSHPDEWDTQVTLSGNKANGDRGNSIFASSIFPCVYARNDTTLNEDISDTFCNWKTWTFDVDPINCSAEIVTEPYTFKNRSYNVSLYPGIWQTIEDFAVFDDLHHDVTKSTIFTTCSSTDREQSTLNPPLVTSSGIRATGPIGTSGWFELQTADSRSIYSSLHIQLVHCPPGLTLRKNESCVCNGRSFKGNVMCNSEGSRLVVGFCISYYNHSLLSTRCPFFTGEHAFNSTVLPKNVSDLDTICNKVGRMGKFCGHCLPNKCIDIFSSTYECKNDTHHLSRWFEAFAVTLLPLTVFFTIAVVFHISMTSASTNGYLFFSHVMTIQIQVLVIRSGWNLMLTQQHFHNVPSAGSALSKIILIPYSIWNFDFFRIADSSVCLHSSLRIMHVLALHYIIALYPILLIIATYVIIELHARNCRVIVCLWRPLCSLCVRFRRNWELRTSVIDAFATFTLLSYSKVIGVSFLLLTPSPVILEHGTKVDQTLNFDPNVAFFKHDHWPFGLCAAFILLVCAAIPVLLILYPFQWFQRLLNTLKLNRPGLQIFVCAFQGCFKDGTNGTPDRRYFAGIYFLMRIIIFLTYTLTDDLVALYSWLVAIHVLFLLLLLILQPYKYSYYNYLDGFFLAILAITSSASVYMLNGVYTDGILSAPAWYTTMALMLIPTIYVIGHLTGWICLRSRWCRQCCDRIRRGGATSEGYQDPFGDDEDASSVSTSSSTRLLHSMTDAPDRMENPERYHQQEGARDSGLSPSWAESPGVQERNILQQTEYGAATY